MDVVVFLEIRSRRIVVGCGTFGGHRADWWSFGIGCANRGCSEKKSENSGRIVADVGAFQGAHGKGHSGHEGGGNVMVYMLAGKVVDWCTRARKDQWIRCLLHTYVDG
jgi:hypothetical protein